MTFRHTCPYCGGVITPTGWTHGKQMHQRGVCANCYERVTIVITPDAVGRLANVNRDAPFYPLVELIDSLTGAPFSTQEARSSTGGSQGRTETVK